MNFLILVILVNLMNVLFSGNSVESDYHGDSVDYGEPADSRKSDNFGESVKPVDSGESDNCGVLVTLVFLVFLLKYEIIFQ